MRQLRRSEQPGALGRRNPVLHPPGAGPDGSGMNPSRTQVAASLVATATVAELTALPVLPVGKPLAVVIIATAARLAENAELRKLDRRLGVYAASWAGAYLNRFASIRELTVLRPATHLVNSLLGDSALRAIGALQSNLLAQWPGTTDGAHTLDLRLVRRCGVSADGTPAMTLEQLTSAHTAAAVGLDGYAASSLAAHFALGQAIAGFAGVRLLAPRVPLASRHYLSLREHHLVGACAHCAPTGRRAATPAQPTSAVPGPSTRTPSSALELHR